MRVVLIPVKSFRMAKHRLAGLLADEERIDLARNLAGRVVAAAKATPVYVACDDGEVADWAIGAGAFVLWTPGLGLSGAVTESIAHLETKGATLVVVAHADLALVEALDEFGTEGAVTLAPDRRLDGTNVAAVPAAARFRFAYGPGSFERHRTEAARLSLPCHIVHDSSLAADVDTPEDFALVRDSLDFTR